jgi:hypothetical protein
LAAYHALKSGLFIGLTNLSRIWRVKGLRSQAINNCRNNGVAVNTKAGEVDHVNHGVDAGDCDVCFGFVSVGYIHVVFGTSGEVLEHSLSIMDVFYWGRKRERSIELASLLSKVTPSVG